MKIPPKRPSVVEEKIEEAIKRGDFNNLKGKGRPLNLHGDLSDAKTMGQKLRSNAGFGAPWEEVRAEIDGLTRRIAATTQQARQANTLADRDAAHREAENLLRLANSRILHYNLIIPPLLPHLHRARLKLEDF